MDAYRISRLARVSAEADLHLQIGDYAAAHVELIISATQLDGLYTLAELSEEDLDALVRERLDQGDAALSALVESAVLGRGPHTEDTDPLGYAFALSRWLELKRCAERAPVRRRDAVAMIDALFPEPARHSIDAWSRTLPYRRIDIDTPDARDLHWIFTMTPATHYVRATPFLRAIDDAVRGLAGDDGLTLMRAYIYAGGSADIYRAHRDSDVEADLTAIYYPMKWDDHFGGELLFYDQGEPRWAVAPRANRLIVFNGAREHRIGAISASADRSRCSIVLRYGAAAGV